MNKIIFIFLSLLFTYKILDNCIYSQSQYIGSISDCKEEPKILCNTLYLPSRYFLVRKKCFNKIISKNYGAIINFYNVSMYVDYIFIEQDYYYIKPLSNSGVDNIKYIFPSNKYVKFLELTKQNEKSVNISTIGDISDYNDSFIYYNKENDIIFVNITIYPVANITFTVIYQNYSLCQKNNMIFFKEELYDKSCEVIL